MFVLVVIFVMISMQQRVQQGLEDGARLPCLDIEKLRGENNTLREEQQRLKKVCCYLSVYGVSSYKARRGTCSQESFYLNTPLTAFISELGVQGNLILGTKAKLQHPSPTEQVGGRCNLMLKLRR